MLTLHHVPFSRSLRVRWLLEELGVEYTLATHSFGELKRPEYLAIHPLGKVPAIVDDERGLFESGAIVTYLLERHGEGRLEPKRGTKERVLYWQWFHYAEATLMPPLGQIVRHTVLLPEAERSAEAAAGARVLAEQALAPVERALAGRSWLLPEFSAADVMLGYSVKLASLLRLVGDATPALAGFLARCEERPAYRRAVA